MSLKSMEICLQKQKRAAPCHSDNIVCFTSHRPSVRPSHLTRGNDLLRAVGTATDGRQTVSSSLDILYTKCACVCECVSKREAEEKYNDAGKSLII